MARVLLREVLDAERRRDAEVDRLAGELGERAQGRERELDEAHRSVLMREAEQHRAGRDAPVAGALHEPASLERADQSRGGRLGEARARRELADPERPVRFDDADEQLRRAVDRLCPGFRGHLAHMVEHEFHGCQAFVPELRPMGATPVRDPSVFPTPIPLLAC